MNSFWNELPIGYYDKIISEGLIKNRGIRANWHNLTFIKVAKLIKKNQYHLDYACGSGTFIGKYIKTESVGIDIAEPQIEYAKSIYGSDNIFVNLKSFNHSQLDKKFDVITVLGLLEFLSEHEILDLIKKLNSMLNKNGRIILTVPCFSKMLRIILKFSKLIGLADYSNQHKQDIGLNKIKEMLACFKYEKINIIKIVNIGVFFSIINLELGSKIENQIEKKFDNKYGFLYLIEIKK